MTFKTAKLQQVQHTKMNNNRGEIQDTKKKDYQSTFCKVTEILKTDFCLLVVGVVALLVVIVVVVGGGGGGGGGGGVCVWGEGGELYRPTSESDTVVVIGHHMIKNKSTRTWSNEKQDYPKTYVITTGAESTFVSLV